MTNPNDSNSNIGSLRLALNRDDVDADVEIDEPRLARTDLWDSLCSELADQFVLAVERLAADIDDRGELYGLITAAGLPEDVASFATTVAGPHKEAARSQIDDWAKLGRGGIGIDANGGGLEDVTEVLRLLDVAGHSPRVKLSLPLAWSDAGQTRRSRWLSFVTSLSASLSITLSLSRLDMRQIVEQHNEEIPASTVSHARQTALTGVAPIESAATNALEDLGDESPHWRVLAVLSENAAESVAVADLSSHMYLADVSRSAVSKRVTRLVDLRLVERITVDGQKHVQLLPAGAYALSEVRCGDTASQPDLNPSSGSDQTGSVNDPRNNNGITVDPQTRSGETPPHSSAEAASVTADAPPSRSTQQTDWMRADAHHAAVAATRDVDIAVCDDVLTASDHSADLGISKNGNEIVVSFEASRTMARTGARLALSLADNRLMIPILDDIDEDDDFAGLVESDPVVLRLARQIGWLSDRDESGAALANRLKAAREEILDLLSDLGHGDNFDSGIAQELTRKAHGLAGTLTHLYEMAGYEVIRSIEIRDLKRNWKKPESLITWIANQQAICSRYGHYPLFRVQIDDREENREAMLGAPVVDVSDPKGSTVGKWVLRGSGTSMLQEDLANLWSRLESVDEDARNYREFLIHVDVGPPGRNEIATALHRLAGMKNLEATRQTISVLHALTDSVFDAAEALYRLGGQDFGREREIYLQEIRVALTALSPAQIMPQVDNGSTGKIVHALLEHQGNISTAELANAADVSRKTISDKADLLRGIGLVEIIDRGPGRSKQYRLLLPWERDDRDTKPEPLEHNWFGEMDVVHDCVHELVQRISSSHEWRKILDDWWFDCWMDVVDGESTVFALIEPIGLWLKPWVDILARIVDASGPRAPPEPEGYLGTMGADPGHDGQISLDEAVARMARTDGGSQA